MPLFNRVQNVRVFDGFILEVLFKNGIIKYYDVTPLFDRWDIFKQLRDDYNLFSSVSVDAGGYGISWNDEIDLECEDLWEYGKSQEDVSYNCCLQFSKR